MAKVKSTKMLKREVVVPFQGEENFVVPKRGGFGQPDMEGYVMATGGIDIGGTPTSPAPSTSTNTQIGTDVGTTTSTSSPTQTGSTTITGASAEPTLPSTSGQVSTPQSNLPATTSSTVVPPKTVTTLGNDSTPSDTYTPSQAQLDCEANGGIWSNGSCTMPPKNQPPSNTVTELPTFPNWDSLNCTALKSEIDKINQLMATSKFAPEIVNAYNTQLALANQSLLKNCSSKPTPPPTPIIPVVPVGGGGIFGGGGGGGFGEEPQAEVPQEEPKSGFKQLLIVLGVIGVAYYFLKK